MNALRRAAHACAGRARGFSAVPTNLQLIKEVRDRSGAPMHEVKAALVASSWDADAALEELRKRGLSAVSKKAARVAAEGLVGVASAGRAAVLVELNTETDFIARMPQFQALVASVAEAVLQAHLGSGAVELADDQLQALLLKSGQPVSSAVAGFAAEVRENVKLRRAFLLTADSAVGCYAHAGPSRAAGRIGSAVSLALHGADAPADGRLEAFAAQLAMHVAAFNPKYVRVADIPAAVTAAERTSFEAQAAASGKPSSVADRMVEGWLKKWHAEVCLEHQPFLIDDSLSVGAAVTKLGVEKKQVDFAAEVASAAGLR